MSTLVSQAQRLPDPAIPNVFPDRPILIGSEIYRTSRYGVTHPLSIQRVTPVMDLARALNLLDDSRFVDSPMATADELARFHAPDYVAAVIAAERDGFVSDAAKERYNIGRSGNPVFPEIFSRPATAAGASLLAGRTLAAVERGTIHSLAGGTHHGRPAMAYGFCYFNDPVLGILAMLDGGLARVLYVDLDAHHGDGVQDAFHDEDRVLTISIHEDDRWPRTGPAEDRAGGMARNFPVPRDLNDSELRFLIEEAILPIGEDFRPDAIVIQSGCDALADDPQSRLSLSNNAIWDAVDSLSSLAPRVLVVGGGGYNPWAVARCWTGIWARLNGVDPRSLAITDEAESILRSLVWNHSRGRNPPEHWFMTIADDPLHGDVRQTVQNLVRSAR
ncbi:acetoin utilization protein AcuC [Nisaea sp.]|uniref:acetoin utilization protein AcuC n=1 Tax=Nisaea sp. TaxID=2024842 RepID=UPI0032F0790D